MAKSLKERKEMLVKKWEECFEQKIGDHLSIKGLSVFWSDDTSYEAAVRMLDKASVLLLIQSFTGVIDTNIEGNKVTIVIVGDDEEEGEDEPTPKPCEGSEKKGSFRVVLETDTEDGHEELMYPHKFETPDKAEEFIKKICMTTKHYRDKFKIVQEMV